MPRRSKPSSAPEPDGRQTEGRRCCPSPPTTCPRSRRRSPPPPPNTLPSPPREAPPPPSDRRNLRVGIVHVGVGGFHRAHQAMYVDRLLNDGKALEWGICGVGVLPSDRRMADAMSAQDA